MQLNSDHPMTLNTTVFSCLLWLIKYRHTLLNTLIKFLDVNAFQPSVLTTPNLTYFVSFSVDTT